MKKSVGIRNFDTRWKQWSVSNSDGFRSEKERQYPLSMKLGRRRSRSEHGVEEKNIWPHLELNLDSPIQPVA
jgi:hypothetical protein